MRILLVASEMEGLVKTGGLADVVRGLSATLRAAGVDIRVVMPYYKQRIQQPCDTLIPSLSVSLSKDCQLGVAVRTLDVSQVPVYLIEHDRLYDRRGVYDDGYAAFDDNGLRFALLSKAALNLCEALNWYPSVVHCNDWQTAILPYYLKRHFAGHPGFKKTRSLLTLHNGFFQGRIPNPERHRLGIDEADYIAERFEDHQMVNLLKGGIAFADGINSVSPGYRDELLEPDTSHGLWRAYQARAKHFTGILNGCDYGHWDPQNDPLIPQQFSNSALAGKQQCKKALQQAMGLPVKPRVPVFGIVSRLTDQKGFLYLLPALGQLLSGKDQPFQLVVLGDGDPVIAQQLTQLQEQHPQQVRFHRGYNEVLAHEIEAGSDFFLMPSLFEPCGLNQIYSLKYGTLPIVRHIGGLKNTVVGLAPDHANQSVATGFSFEQATPVQCQTAIEQALGLWYFQPEVYKMLQQNAMAQDFSWAGPADAYRALYRSLRIRNVA